MATVSLQTVFDDARRAIETGAADKAIGIGQHVLVHFPRMIEASRLLGEAYLNAGQPEQAAAAFAQVLDADPENVAAYYGRGLALQSMEQRPAAIMAFERALEIQPNLADLRTQLMRLYAETPGSAGQFRLSRAGLGRLYARGGMFTQAIDEFRAVLDVEPNRDDVKVALAEALWRDGQEDEATDYCRDVLDQQPELLKPTVLLGYMLFAAGQPEGEALWRRAAEQDATMALPRTLFDILPPIRIEEPVVPEFDEAEWRAKQARRAATPPAPPAAVAPVAADDDFFADSWLNSAGSSSAASNTTQVYDVEPVAVPITARAVGGSSDDDLLASLLGFGADDSPPEAAPEPQLGDVQSFAFDEWDAAPQNERSTDRSTQPLSLDDIGLEDEPTASADDNQVAGVQPFSLDDWSFDDDSATSATPAAQATQPANDDFDLSDIEAFSLEDEPAAVPARNESGPPQPFNFADDASVVGDVKPFSLDDDDDLGIGPFSFDDEPAAASADTTAEPDAGLGAVQPFSLDEWGMDDNDAPGASASTANRLAQTTDTDDLGDFKPFSLDELALDTLDNDTSSALNGPIAGEEEDRPVEPTTFNWEEPTWRAHVTSGSEDESDANESIFAKLMRNRPADQTQNVVPPASDDLPEEERFFSMDDESLRLDLDNISANESTSEFADPVPEEPAAAGAAADFGPAVDASTSAAQQFGQPAAATDEAALPFSLDDLASSDQSFSWETEGATEAAGQPGANQDVTPFSLSELGLSDDDIAALDQQPELAADASEPAPSSELEPFSLSDLGFSDDELAALDFGDAQAAPGADAEPSIAAAALQGGTAAVDNIAESAPQPAENDDPDLVPFSLGELGLTDDEIALLNEGESATQVEALNTAAPVFEDFESIFADASDAGVTDSDGTTDQAGNDDEQASWLDLQSQLDVDMPATRTPDDFLMEAKVADGDLQSVLETMPTEEAADADSDMVPFSLADLGLNDDELALFEPGQNQQPEATAGSGPPDDAAPPSPFALSDFDLTAEQAADDAHSPSSLLTDEIVLPFTMAEPAVAEESGAAGNNSTAEQLPASGFAPADDQQFAAGVTERQAEPADAAPQTLPTMLPEGAQPLAATAEAPVGASSSPAFDAADNSDVDGGLAAIQAQLAADPENDTMRFAVARMSQSMGHLNHALEQYKTLIKRGRLLDEVVEDLQDTIAENDDPQTLRRLHRLLGDAYMKQNRLREAMDEYSWTLAR
ncbi:MAG: tetratricopeptide repeat protein [Chloroflexota bacterium]|nr:tetratricopeptide repeat protein [Chloroflexota bacterium]